MLWIIAILILLIFAPYLLALLGVAAIPIIFAGLIGILYGVSSVYLKGGKVKRLEKKFRAEEYAKYQEILMVF
jgi:CHASE2 domain-containing sensor protein